MTPMSAGRTGAPSRKVRRRAALLHDPSQKPQLVFDEIDKLMANAPLELRNGADLLGAPGR